MQNIYLELKRNYVWQHLLQAKKYVWEKPLQKSVDENLSKAKFFMKHLSSRLEISLTNGRRCI